MYLSYLYCVCGYFVLKTTPENAVGAAWEVTKAPVFDPSTVRYHLGSSGARTPWHGHSHNTENVADLPGPEKRGHLPAWLDATQWDLCFSSLNFALWFLHSFTQGELPFKKKSSLKNQSWVPGAGTCSGVTSGFMAPLPFLHFPKCKSHTSNKNVACCQEIAQLVTVGWDFTHQQQK